MTKPINVDNGIAKTPVFRARRTTLRGYIYALIRLMEHAGAWISTDSNIDFKFALGQQVGLIAQDIHRLRMRILTLLESEVAPIVSPAYECSLEHGAELTTSKSRSSFLSSALAGVATHMETFIATTHSTGDAPTILILREAIQSIRDQVNLLAPFVVDASPLKFIDPSSDPEARVYSGEESLPILLDFPARPGSWKFSDAMVFSHRSNADLVARGEHLRRWLHEVGINVEIDAMELCGRNIAEYRDMPLDFKLDMARQTWDETRHAMMMRSVLRDLGGDFGDYTFNGKVWRRYMLGDDLAERLAIEQVFQEGNALEANIPFCESLCAIGAWDLAEIIDYIDADELQHARSGNKWLTFLCDGSERRYVEILQRCAHKLGIPLKPRAPLLDDVRRMVGYPDEFIRVLSSP
ncbi:DUF455 family protein [Luteibacter sp. 3190]|uniref:DUF455 family protein n=1 Tax=Luteibacter sp. 3190 TaxID=2817736 RepID=UPI002859EE48|nr:DUF455 family protein [Luteibacter sp. 3190]MDR6935333.1 uncharacterized ferritin-like protein (DUF455 family) [Luteibacter sp. 3190]